MLQLILFRRRGVCEFILLVVFFDEVFEDGAGFPQCDAGVGVFDGRGAAVGAQLLVLGLLEVGEVPELVLVGDVELLEEEDDLPAEGEKVSIGSRNWRGRGTYGLGPPAWPWRRMGLRDMLCGVIDVKKYGIKSQWLSWSCTELPYIPYLDLLVIVWPLAPLTVVRRFHDVDAGGSVSAFSVLSLHVWYAA